MGQRQNKIRKILKGVLVSFFALALLMGYFLPFSWGEPVISPASLEASASNAVVEKIIPESSYPLRNWAVGNLELAAASAISVQVDADGTSKLLFSKNETQKLPVASLTKLMTALVVMERYDLRKQVAVSPAAMAQEGVQGLLKEGEVLTVKDLLYLALIESSNRAAYALAESMGVQNFIGAMNADAKALGLKNTYFADTTGLSPDSYSTAQDIAVLSAFVFKNYPLFGQIIGMKEYDLYLPNGQFHHRLGTTNKLLGEIPGMLGGKTGYTSQAKGCFMSIEKAPTDGSYIFSVVLGSDDRFAQIKNIIDWTATAYVWQ